MERFRFSTSGGNVTPNSNTKKFRFSDSTMLPIPDVTTGERIGYGAAGLALGLAHGVASAAEGITDFFAGTALQIAGQKEAAKDIYKNSWSGNFRKWIEDEINPDGNKAFSTYLDIVSGVGNAASQVGLAWLSAGGSTALLGGKAAVVGAKAAIVKTASLAPIFVSATGSGTAEAVQTTGDLGFKENAYGLASGGLELVMESVVGTPGKVLRKTGVLGSAEKQAVKEISKHAVLKGIASNAGSEFMEEAATEWASTYLKRITKVDPNAKATKEDIFRAGIYGAIAGGVIGGGMSTYSAHTLTKSGRRIIAEGNERATVAEAKALVSAAQKTTDRGFLDMDTVARVEKALELYGKDKDMTESRRAYYIGQMSAGLLTVGTYASAHEYAVKAVETVAQGGEAAKALIDGANAMFEENLGRKLTAEDFKDTKALGSRMLASVNVYNSLVTPTDAESIDLTIRNDTAVAYSEAALRADAEKIVAGTGTALYNLGNGNYAVVTKRKGDDTYSVGMIRGKNTAAPLFTHYLKTVDNVVQAVEAMRNGTYAVAPSATAPTAQNAPEAKAEPKKPEASASSDSVAQKKATVKKKEQKSTTETAKSAKKSETERKETVSRAVQELASDENIETKVAELQNGEKLLQISLEEKQQKVLSELSEKERRKFVEQYIRKHFRNIVFEMTDGSKVVVTSTGANKIANTLNETKQRIALELEKLFSVATLNSHKNADDHPKFSAFDYYNALVQVGENAYSCVLNVGTTKGSGLRQLYEVNQIKKTDVSPITGHPELATSRKRVVDTSANNSISHSAEKVNPKNAENEKKVSEQKKTAAKPKPTEKKAEVETDEAVEARMSFKRYDGATFDAKEISAARADYKLFDTLPSSVRKSILIMRRSAAESKIQSEKVKGITRLMAAYRFRAVFSSEIKSNGFWMHGKNLTVINPNNIYQTTFGHELTHRVEDYKEYPQFAAAVEKMIGKRIIEAEMKKYLADYNAAAEANGWEKWDAEKNAADLKREAIASMIGKYLSNAQYIDRLARADRNFVYRIYRAIKGMRADIALAHEIASETERSTLTEYRTIRRMEKVFETALTVSEEQRNGDVDISRLPRISKKEALKKRDRRLARKRGKVYNTFAKMVGDVFPPEDESWSDAHKWACIWAGKKNVHSGDQAIQSCHGQWFVIEKFDGLDYPYQIVDLVTAEEAKRIAKEIKEYGRSGQIKSVQGETNEADSSDRQSRSADGSKSATPRLSPQHRGKDTPIYEMGEEQNRGSRERPESDRGGDRQRGEQDQPRGERENEVSYSPSTVESRIQFGTPARQSALSRIKKTVMRLADADGRREIREGLREVMDTFSVYASNSFAAVETQLRRMAKDGEWNGRYGRITRQRAQEWAQYVRLGEAKGLGMLTYGQYKADGTAYEQSDSFFSIINPILAPKGETIEALLESGDTVETIIQKAKGGELNGERYRQFSDYIVAKNALERSAQGKSPFASKSDADLQAEIAMWERQHPEFKEIAEKMSVFNKNLLQYKVDTGTLSQEAADTMYAMYHYYVPKMKPTEIT